MNPQTPYGWLKEFCEKNGFPFYGIHLDKCYIFVCFGTVYIFRLECSVVV